MAASEAALAALRPLERLARQSHLDTVAAVEAAAQRAAPLWLVMAATHQATQSARPSMAQVQEEVAQHAPSAQLAARWLELREMVVMLALQLAQAAVVVAQSLAPTLALETLTQS